MTDLITISGNADDLTSLIAALGAVAMCITPEVKQAAKQKVEDWFGPIASSSNPGHSAPGDAPRTIEID